MARDFGYNFAMPIAFESAYGTAESSGFVSVPVNNFGIKESRDLNDDPRLGQGRDPVDPYQGRRAVDGPVTVPVDVANFGYWMRQLFGAPDTSGSSTYTHVFTSGAASLPSICAEAQYSSAAVYNMFTGLKAKSLQMSFSDDGPANAVIDMVGQAETPAATTQAGTPSSETFEAFRQFHGNVQLDGSDLGNLMSATLNYDNGLIVDRLVGGNALIAEPAPGPATMSGDLNLRFTDKTLFDKARAKTSVELDFVLEISASKKLSMNVPVVYLEQTGIPVDGPGGLDVSFNWRAAYSSSDEFMLQSTLINAVSGY
jgi:hypothetical protein